MFSKIDILNRLKKGEDADSIAAEMAKTLNEAKAEKEAFDAKVKAEKELAEAKVSEMETLLAAFAEYCEKYNKDLVDCIKNLNAKDVCETIDVTSKITVKLPSFFDINW